MGILISICIFCLLTPTSGLEKNICKDKQFHKPSEISKLELHLPPLETIHSFEQYQQQYPYTLSSFSNKKMVISENEESIYISILVTQNIYTSTIQSKINQYINDLATKSYAVLSLDTLSGGNPKDVKDWVKREYQKGSEGVLFIGDIPAAWAEVSGDIFPCDLFYMDIDGTWKDNDNDGVYESHTEGSGDMGPELYVSRLFASSFNWNDEEILISDYFDKIHQYYAGDLVVPWRGLEYIEEDWYDMNIYSEMIFNQNISHYDNGYFTTGEDYLSQLSKGHHFVTVCAHSYPGGHHFGKRPTESVTYAHLYVHSPIQRDAKVLIGSDDGIISWLNGEEILHYDRYQGWYVNQHKIDITLNQGWNRLLCKVSQESGDHQLSVQFTDGNLNSLSDLTYQINNPEYYPSEAPYIRSWLVNAFHQDSPDYFYNYLDTNYLGVSEKNVMPEEGQSMGGKTWTRLDKSSPYIDLDEYNNEADYGVSYAYVTVHSEQSTNCELWIGCDDGIKAWLNGENIIFDNRYGEYQLDMIKIPVTLQSGDNHLLVKISEWMGDHGFSARFCTNSGEIINGLTYSPEPEPISYIGTWLIAGPFANEDSNVRLLTSYIDNEATVSPSIGENASSSTWQRAIGKGKPFDFNSFFDHGDWVYSSDIQSADPPVLFYNLFACSAGRFTEENYLSGSYIFNTSYGLVCVASSKSGSMLNFQDFAQPLANGNTIGDAFIDWFDTQAPFAQWEKEWYYGMMLCGDPTLTISKTNSPQLSIDIVSPSNGLYVKENKILPFFVPVIFGDATIKIEIINQGYGIDKVIFYNGQEVLFTDDDAPFEFVYNETTFGKRVITVKAIDTVDNIAEESVTFWKFF